MVIKGKIVTLRSIAADDAEITLKWRLSDRAKLMQRGAKTVEEQKGWINSKLSTPEVNCIIEYKQKPVGMISLHDIDYVHNHLIIGRLLVGEEEFVAKAPVAYEAELLLCDYAFKHLHMHKIYGDVVGTNPAMLKFRKYLGYKEDGVMRDHLFFNGSYIDAHTFSLLENEYQAVCRPKLVQLITLMTNYN
jgi:RimJ/RimL family protein N-acetyltransferase